MRWSSAKTLVPANKKAPGNVLVHMQAGDTGRLIAEFWQGQSRQGKTPVWRMTAAETTNALAGKPHVIHARISKVTADVGTAAAVKMCRSIVVKGLEALMCECVLAASRFDADAHVFASLNESFPGIDWKTLADYMVGRVVLHGERRAREMEEVADTLRAIGVEPIMAEAAARRQDWSAHRDLRSHFGPEGPATYREVLDVIASTTTRA